MLPVSSAYATMSSYPIVFFPDLRGKEKQEGVREEMEAERRWR
jgi:hypothetical protein